MLNIDQRATPAQRQALLRILAGEDTEPGANERDAGGGRHQRGDEPLLQPVEGRG